VDKVIRPDAPLQVKYRPQNLDEIIGNDATVIALKNELAKAKDRTHTFLFSGPKGTGKTTTARILAHELQAYSTDFKEVNAARDRGIASIREITSQCHYGPISLDSKTKVYLFDEAHGLTKDASEALLKITEDGMPPHVYFIFATTNPEKLLPTLMDRCTVYKFRKLDRPEMMLLLKWVTGEEGITLYSEVIRKILGRAEGFPRKALSLLNQVIKVANKEEALELLEGFSFEEDTLDLCRALFGPEPWSSVAKILKNLDEDVETVRLSILGYFAQILLNKGDKRAALIMNEFTTPLDRNGKSGLILNCFCAKTMI
jgi:DNA polymerase III subunit gamma/tau